MLYLSSLRSLNLGVQIYETSTPEEAQALGEIGVDHIGVLVGDGSFPREHSIDQAREILSAVPAWSEGSVLILTSGCALIGQIARELRPSILSAPQQTCWRRQRWRH